MYVRLVFDFMDTDLEIIIKDTNVILTPPHIKAYMLDTLKGLEYLHTHNNTLDPPQGHEA